MSMVSFHFPSGQCLFEMTPEVSGLAPDRPPWMWSRCGSPWKIMGISPWNPNGINKDDRHKKNGKASVFQMAIFGFHVVKTKFFFLNHHWEW